MLIVDAHCDTALSVYKNNGDLYENQFQLDIKRLKGIGRCVQFFASFAHPHDYRNDTLTRVLSILDVVYEAQQEHGEVFAVCTSADDIKGRSGGKTAAILSVEWRNASMENWLYSDNCTGWVSGACF